MNFGSQCKKSLSKSWTIIIMIIQKHMYNKKDNQVLTMISVNVSYNYMYRENLNIHVLELKYIVL